MPIDPDRIGRWRPVALLLLAGGIVAALNDVFGLATTLRCAVFPDSCAVAEPSVNIAAFRQAAFALADGGNATLLLQGGDRALRFSLFDDRVHASEWYVSQANPQTADCRLVISDFAIATDGPDVDWIIDMSTIDPSGLRLARDGHLSLPSFQSIIGTSYEYQQNDTSDVQQRVETEGHLVQTLDLDFALTDINLQRAGDTLDQLKAAARGCGVAVRG